MNGFSQLCGTGWPKAPAASVAAALAILALFPGCAAISWFGGQRERGPVLTEEDRTLMAMSVGSAARDGAPGARADWRNHFTGNHGEYIVRGTVPRMLLPEPGSGRAPRLVRSVEMREVVVINGREYITPRLFVYLDSEGNWQRFP